MTRSRRSSIRKTPSSLNTMTVSDFVRGGLYDIDKPTVIVTHGEPMGMWVPRGQYEAMVGVNGAYYSSSLSTAGTPLRGWTAAASSSAAFNTLTNSTVPDIDRIREAVSTLNAYLNPQEDTGGEEEGR